MWVTNPLPEFHKFGEFVGRATGKMPLPQVSSEVWIHSNAAPHSRTLAAWKSTELPASAPPCLSYPR